MIDWEKHRRELLDTGLRNSLISYRPSSARGVEIVGESSTALFQILVKDRRKMSFLPNPEGNSPDHTEVYELSEEELKDSNLQTLETRDKLLKRLLNSYHTARLHMEERGFNNLFLALGFLQWYESESSDKERFAPLVLIPVSLIRTSVRQQYRLVYNDEDVETNLSLQNKLKAEFGIELPPLPETLEDLDVEEYFAQCEEAISGNERWSVQRDTVHLGFFSFMKLLMYQDLNLENWPDEFQPDTHPIFSSLAKGEFPGADTGYPDDQKIDEILKVENASQVTDADSTQLLAILDVHNGRNLVIQGPPGTGKSQTITNLVADALHSGKSVLFVAEKMAALEVVKRRLDQLGLGDACLELHSHKTNKKEVLKELDRTLGLQDLKSKESSSATLQSLIDELNQYGSDLNGELGDSGFSPYMLFGLRAKLDIDPEILNEVPKDLLPDETPFTEQILKTSRSDFESLKIKVEVLQSQLVAMGLPMDHPFFGCNIEICLPNDKIQIKEALLGIVQSAKDLGEAIDQVDQQWGLDFPRNLEGASSRESRLSLIAEMPSLERVVLDSALSESSLETISQTLGILKEAQGLRKQLESQFYDKVWEEDLLGELQVIREKGKSFWKFLSGEYKRAVKKVLELSREGRKLSPDEMVERLDAIQRAKELDGRIQKNEDVLKSVFGSNWRNLESDTEHLQAIVEFVEKAMPLLSSDLLNDLPNRDSALAKKDAGELATRMSAQTACLGKLEKLLKFCDSTKEWWEQSECEDIIVWTEALVENLHAIDDQVAFNHLAATFTEHDLDWLVEVAKVWEPGSEHLLDFFCLTWFDQLLRHAFQTSSSLAGFSSSVLSSKIENFRSLDSQLLQLNQKLIAQQHRESLPSRTNAGGQMGVLLKEIGKKTRHIPIRKLMKHAGKPIQAIKPVFMMSPMSVAAYLGPDSVEFDLVIFDEASQVKPVDAYGALLRGKQAVVVGDSKQMPPTSFFDSMGSEDEDTEEDLEAATVSVDLESILNVMVSRGSPERMLRWHYRSRHDSLIAPSNQEFYEGRLHTFPSPFNDHAELGLKFHHLEHTYYESGKAVNMLEARAIAERVLHHALNYPDQSLGVVAFSTRQRDAILNEVEELRRETPEAELYFQKHEGREPAFVKNLETVQGDERDVIYISVGYGKNKDGKMSMSFGPVNSEGGERRLNVLFTRSRMRVEVFANFTYADIDLSRTSKIGPRILKSYLRYAQEGLMDLPEVSGKLPDSPFEEAVADTLRDAGLAVECQVGSGGYFVDIAVKDPETQGRYLLGIECDGAAYHSSQSARDRDRIRQSVLESLGWRIHRIWSTDWFRDAGQELKKVLEVVEKAKLETLELPTKKPNVPPEPEPIAEEEPIPPKEEKKAERPEPTNVYTLSQLDISIAEDQEFVDIHHQTLASWIVRVVDAEGPIRVDEVLKRIRQALEISRTTQKIKSYFQKTLETCLKMERVEYLGDFLNIPGRELAIRNRSDIPTKYRKAELIPDQEYQLAILKVIGDAFEISKDEIPNLALDLLGISKATTPYTDKINENLQALEDQGKVTSDDGQYSLTD